MKKIFEKVEIKIVLFNQEDIIRTSGETSGEVDGDDERVYSKDW